MLGEEQELLKQPPTGPSLGGVLGSRPQAWKGSGHCDPLEGQCGLEALQGASAQAVAGWVVLKGGEPGHEGALFLNLLSVFACAQSVPDTPAPSFCEPAQGF